MAQDPDGTRYYEVTTGGDLGEYVGKGHGPIHATIKLGYIGDAVDPTTGKPNAAWLADRPIVIRIRAFDVDAQQDKCASPGAIGVDGQAPPPVNSNCSGPDPAPPPTIDGPERDDVWVNGVNLGSLHGEGGISSDTDFTVKAGLLFWGPTGDQTRDNSIEVMVNTDSHVKCDWKAKIESVQVRLPYTSIYSRPTIFIHGLYGQESSWREGNDFITDFYVNGVPVTSMKTVSHGSYRIDADVAQVEQQIDEWIDATGWYQVNLVGHSLGGLVARRWAFTHPGRVASLVTISAPSGGLPEAKGACEKLNAGHWVAGPLGFVLAPDCNDSVFFDLQEWWVQQQFNVYKAPDLPAIRYMAIGGRSSVPCGWAGLFVGAQEIGDGCVTRESAYYMTSSAGHHGLETQGKTYPYSHDQLLHEDDVQDDVFCMLYKHELPGCTVGQGGVTAPSARVPASALSGDGSSSQASALSGDGSSAQVSTAVAQTVPAGGSIDIPLAFEQSPTALVSMYTDGTPVTASIGGVSLTPDPSTAGSLAATLTNPTDGNLHVVNSGTTEARVAVVVMIPTTRTLTITAPAHQYAHGAAVDFDIVLTEPQAGDTATAQLLDPAGSHTDVTLTSAGYGHWRGHLTPEGGGSYTILVAVPGARPRQTSYEILVASGTVAIASGFSQRLDDSGRDGLADKLVLSPTVTVQSPGTYSVVGHLVDSSGTEIDVTGGDVDLVAGSQTVDLAFDGSTIYASGKSGPYRLVNVAILSKDVVEASVSDMGTTKAYDYHLFQHFRVLIDQNSLAMAPVVDAGTGLYTGLQLSGQVWVEEANDYVITAGLFASDGTEVGRFVLTPELTAGTNSFTAVFDGPTIWQSGEDGPYVVGDLSVSLRWDSAVRHTIGSALTSPAYTRAQFMPPPPTSAVAPTVTTLTMVAAISVPFDATFPGGTGSVEVWQRYTPDGGSAGSWELLASGTQSPISVTLNHGEGSYELHTRAIDAVGQTESLRQTADVTVVYSATVATSSVSPLPPVVTDRTAILPFTVTDNGAGVSAVKFFFRCREPNSPSWVPWSSLGQTTTLTSPFVGDPSACYEGEFEYYSVAVDGLGRQEPAPLVADASQIVDRKAPTSRAGQLPPQVSSSTIQVPFSADDAGGSGISSVELWGHGPGHSYQLMASGTTSPFTVALDQGPGQYQFYTVAVDAAGQREGGPYTPDTSTILDPSTPQLASAVLPLDNTTVGWRWVSLQYWAAYPSGSGSVELWERVKPAGESSFAPWTPVLTTTDWPIVIMIDQDGQYEFYTRAIDSGGAQEDAPLSADATLLVDTTPPTSTLAAIPSMVSSTSYDLGCQASDAGSGVDSITAWYRWSATKDGFSSGWKQAGTCSANGTLAFGFPDGEGYYQFATSAVDIVGNGEPTPVNTEADTLFAPAPESHVAPQPPAVRGGGTLHPMVVSTAPYELWERYAPVGSSEFTSWTMVGSADVDGSVAFAVGPDGRYEFYSIAVSSSGAREAPPEAADVSLIVDSVCPTSTLGQVPLRTSLPTVTVPFTLSDGNGSGVASFYVKTRYRANQDATWGSWWSQNHALPATSVDVPLTSGQGFYQVAIQAVDLAGNYESSPKSVTIHYTTGNDPSSAAGDLAVATNSASINVPYAAEFASGSGSVQLWQRFQPAGSSTYTDWSQVATVTAPQPLDASLSSGDGRYEFFTVAVDGQSGVAEAHPVAADAHTILDTSVPTSSLEQYPQYTTATGNILLTFTTSDPSSSVASVEVWWRFKAPGGSTFSDWQLATAAVNPVDYGYVLFAVGPDDGTYEFYSIAVDLAGNREEPPASADTYTILETVPPTSSAGPLPSAVKSTAIPIPYTATDGANGSGVTSVDLYRRFQAAGSADWTDWTFVKGGTGSPISTYLTLGDGCYEFFTIAGDQAGNFEAWKVVADTFTVLDRTAPTSQAGALPPLVNSTTLVVPYTASDGSGSGLASIQLQRRFKAAGSGSFGSWSTVATVSNPAASGTIPITLGSDGRYEFRTLGTDVAVNVETAPGSEDAWTVLDSTAPVSSAGSLPATTTASSINVAYTASDANGSGVVSVELWQRFQPAGGSMGDWTQIATGTASPFTVALAADGRYEFYTRANDVAGNREAAPASADAFTVRDSTAPLTNAGPLAPAVSSTSLNVPYTITSGTVSSVELWRRWTTPGGTPSGSYTKIDTIPSPAATGNFSITLGSGAGRYEFYTIGVSPSGGRETVPGSADAFTVLDTTAPTSAAASLTTPRTAATVALSYTAQDNTNGTGVVSVDVYERFQAAGTTTWSSWTPVMTATASPANITLSLGDGRYEFYTRALDAAGNREAAPGSFDAFTVLDTTGPVSSVGTLAAGTKTTTLSVLFTATDVGGNGVASVELYERFQAAGSTTWSSYSKVATGTTSPFSVTLGLGAGRYEFYTQAVDSLSNREGVPAAADAFTVLDTTAPTSAAGPLPASITSTALSVPYTAADETGGSGISKVELYQRWTAPGGTPSGAYTKLTATPSGGSFSITLGSGSGTYEFYTIATDLATNAEAAPTSADATTVLTLPDTTAPTSTITAPPSTTSASSISIAYTASDNSGGSGLASVEFWYRYRASDGATPGAWTAGGTSTAASGSFTLTFGSGAGIYDVLTVAVDVAGNREGSIANPPAAGATPKSYVRSISWTASTKVNTDTGSAVQDNAAFAVGSDGTVYAVWEDSRSGNTDIYFSSRNPTTGVWSTEIKLNDDTGTTGQRTPSIAIDGSGNLYVVWADDRNGSTNTDIYFVKRTGTTWSGNIKVNTDTATAVQSNPRIAVSSAGIAVAVWYDKRSSQTNIYSARLPAGSTTWSTNYNVTTSNTSAVKATPDVAVASDGTAWATWQDNRTGAGDIYVASLGPTATTWSTNTKVSDDSSSTKLDKSPRIGLTSANLPVVAYLDGRTTNAQVRVVNRTSGGTWNASVQVSDSSAKPSGGLALAVKADGGVIVAWDDTRSTSAIWGAQCEAGSGTSSVTRCGPAEKWSDKTGASSHPSLVASATKVYLGWRDNTTGGGDILIRLRTPS